jgi:uncharacterized membrane protein
MWNILSQPSVRAILGISVVLFVCWLGFLLVARLRDFSKQDRLQSPDLLTNFKEMHLEGDISEAEFRRIRAVMEEEPS